MIYFRILKFAIPYRLYVPQYAVLITLSIIFGLVNFTLFIPLLDTLFNSVDKSLAVQDPDFSLSIDYFKAKFNYIFQKIIQENGQIAALRFVCIAAVISIVLKNIFRYLAMMILATVRTGVIKNIRDALYHQLIRMHTAYFKRNKKGDLISRLMGDVQEIENSIVDSFTVIFREPLTIIFSFVLLFMMSWQLTAFTLIILPISALIISTIVKKLKKHAAQSQQAMGSILGTIEETITGIKVIKAFNAEANQEQKFQAKTKWYSDSLRLMLFRQYSASPVSETLSVTVVAGIMLYGGSLVLKNDFGLSASEFITYIIVFSQILSPAKAISTAVGNIQRGLVAGERIFEILDAQRPIKDLPNARKLTSFDKEIEFKNVDFTFEDGKQVLKNINFKVEKGKYIALVGPSGGGKSTLSDMIPRFHNPTNGAILIDGHDLRTLQAASIRQFLGVVTQESVLFNDTIYNNIAFGSSDVSEAAVVQAAKIAHAHDFILESAEGYQTIIGDQGLKLSGGQRQRLTIARAILHNPAILILDEATSALDSESEKLVQDALQNLLKGRTSIVIAHRLSTIQHADEILVVQQGEIIERGTHEELLQIEGGLYQKLSLLQ